MDDGEQTTARVLGVFAKQPQPGQVKTRLAAATSAAWAAEVARAFLLDTLGRLEQVAAERLVAFAPAEARSFFAPIVQGRFGLVAQAEGDLGQRMTDFLAPRLQASPTSVVLVGTDSPDLPVAFVEQAFEALVRADLVLGPAMDGGYYLIGCTGRVPPIFGNIAWGTPRVLEQTIAALQGSGHRLVLLPPWYDVDTWADWEMLRGIVQARRRAGLDPAMPNTEKLLQDSRAGVAASTNPAG